MGFLVTILLNPDIIYVNRKSTEQGAASTLRCVSLDDDEIDKGCYYANCWSDNDTQLLPNTVARKSLTDDGKLATKLWELSELLISSKGYNINCSHCSPTSKHSDHKDQ